jgi:hypothetical protein
VLCNVLSKGVFWVGSTEQCLDGEEHSANLESRAPFVFEDVQADTTKLVDVGVVDLGQETNLRDEVMEDGGSGGARKRAHLLTLGGAMG